VGILSRAERLALIGSKIKDLRLDRKYNQQPLADLCGVSRVQVSRWEHGLDLPSAAALLKISELVPESERGWWRDQAADKIGLDVYASDLSDFFLLSRDMRFIPFLKEAKRLSLSSAILPSDIERTLHFPAGWFPEGGEIYAVRVSGAGSQLIAMVDVSRRDASHLVGKMIAVETPSGIEVRWLRLEEATYILWPFQPEQTLKLLSSEGENSIVGLVRWVGPADEAPQDLQVQ